jgi:hypothetical protein
MYRSIFIMLFLSIFAGIAIGIASKPSDGLLLAVGIFIGLLRLRSRFWTPDIRTLFAKRKKYQIKKQAYLERNRLYLEAKKASGRETSIEDMSNVEVGNRIELIFDSKLNITPGSTGIVMKIELVFEDNKECREVFVEWDNELINYETGAPIEDAPLIVGLDEFEIIK